MRIRQPFTNGNKHTAEYQERPENPRSTPVLVMVTFAGCALSRRQPANLDVPEPYFGRPVLESDIAGSSFGELGVKAESWTTGNQRIEGRAVKFIADHQATVKPMLDMVALHE